LLVICSVVALCVTHRPSVMRTVLYMLPDYCQDSQHELC